MAVIRAVAMPYFLISGSFNNAPTTSRLIPRTRPHTEPINVGFLDSGICLRFLLLLSYYSAPMYSIGCTPRAFHAESMAPLAALPIEDVLAARVLRDGLLGGPRRMSSRW